MDQLHGQWLLYFGKIPLAVSVLELQLIRFLICLCFCVCVFCPGVSFFFFSTCVYANSPSGTVLSMTVKLAEKPSLAMALSVLIVSARMPV